MQVTANAGDRKLVVGSLARPTIEKRRNLNRDAHSSTECIPKKAAPAVSPITSGELSEAEAIQRARDGDRTVFEFLYRLHSRRVYAVCLRMVGNTAEAEDLTQEAFLLLLRAKFTPSAANRPSLLGCTDWRLTSCSCVCARSLHQSSRSRRFPTRTMKPVGQPSILERLTCCWRDRLTE
jgi:hypothetical protein